MTLGTYNFPQVYILLLHKKFLNKSVRVLRLNKTNCIGNIDKNFILFSSTLDTICTKKNNIG